jgi:hypothetical protein
MVDVFRRVEVVDPIHVEARAEYEGVGARPAGQQVVAAEAPPTPFNVSA